MVTEKAYYAIVRYVPDPTRGEAVNVGVVVTTRDGEYVGARFDRTAARVRCLSPDEPLDNIRGLADELERDSSRLGQLLMPVEGVSRWNLGMLESIHKNWGNSIQFSEPRAAIDTEPTTLLDQVYDRFVHQPPRTKKRARDKRWVMGQVVPILRESAGVDRAHAVKTEAPVVGKVEEHSFDVVIRPDPSRPPTYAAAALSFESDSPLEVSKSVAVTAWALDDVRKLYPATDLPLAVLVLERDDSDGLARIERICSEFDAALVRSRQLASWADNAARALRSA
jgi:hypothetical protein